MQGAAQYVTAIAQMPKELMPPLLAAFKTWARNFKLGKDVEELLDEAIEGIVPAMQQAEKAAAEQAGQPSPDAQLKAQTDGQIAELRAQVALQIEQIRQQAKMDGEAMRAEIQAALNSAQPDVGPDPLALAKIDADLEKALMKDRGDTERVLIKEDAAMDRALVEAGVKTRGQDIDQEGQMVGVGVDIAKQMVGG